MATKKNSKDDDDDDAGPSPTPPPPPPPPAAALMMETWVLIPAELSLVQPAPSSPSDDGVAQQAAATARVWTRVPVAQGRRWSPFQGTVRLGVMPFSSASSIGGGGGRSSSALSTASSTDSTSAEVRQHIFSYSLRNILLRVGVSHFPFFLAPSSQDEDR